MTPAEWRALPTAERLRHRREALADAARWAEEQRPGWTKRGAIWTRETDVPAPTSREDRVSVFARGVAVGLVLGCLLGWLLG